MGSPKLRHAFSITAADQFSSDVSGTVQAATGIKGIPLYGDFVLRLSGTWNANVVVQRSDDGGITFNDVGDGSGGANIFTANDIYVGSEPCRGILYRAGVKSGGYTSGTVTGEFQQ